MLVARMRRLVPLLFFIPAVLVSARDDSLCESVVTHPSHEVTHAPFPVTSSVTYCSEPDALLIQQFDVVYFQKNSSIWFNISAASVVSFIFNFFLAFNPISSLPAATQCQRVRKRVSKCLWNAPPQLHTGPLLLVSWRIVPITDVQLYWIGFRFPPILSWRKWQDSEYCL